LQFAEVVAVDLIERGVARVAQIAPVGGPFAVLGAGLSTQETGQYQNKQGKENGWSPKDGWG
jgi:hypothetical protein